VRGHTKGPWTATGRYVEMGDREATFGDPDWASETQDEVNAARAVACVNALEGVEDPVKALAMVREALSDAVAILAAHGSRKAWVNARDSLSLLTPAPQSDPVLVRCRTCKRELSDATAGQSGNSEDRCGQCWDSDY
jgi:hypothetical protein